jgi:hypothetical protein
MKHAEHFPQGCKANLATATGDLFIELPFDHEDGGDLFLRNVGLSPSSTALQTRRQYPL